MIEYKKIYQEFLMLSSAVDHGKDFPLLDPVEERVLELLNDYWFAKKKVTVVEAMHMTDDISTSTMFRYLKKLRLKGYISLQIDQDDNRIKYIVFTKMTSNYFAQMGRLMLKVSGCLIQSMPSKVSAPT